MEVSAGADLQDVPDQLIRLESKWNWRVSAHCRIASLVALWGVLMFMAPLGWLLAPLAAIRTGLSLLQTLLNVRLGRKEPLEDQTRLDWVLVAAIFAGGYFAAGVAHVTGDSTSPLLFVPMLVPFTALQARMVRRSFVAGTIQQFRPATLLRLEEFRRAESGELRAA